MRFIEIAFKDFYDVVDTAVHAHQSEDVVIWFDDPISNGLPAAIGTNLASESKAVNGFLVKANPDWAIDLHQNKGNKWKKMIGEKVFEIGKAFTEWCLKENQMIIIISK
jgi:hypothetical protein